MPTGQTIREPARDIPVFRACDVLVVGGGPAGTAGVAAAVAVAAGVRVRDVDVAEVQRQLVKQGVWLPEPVQGRRVPLEP